MTKQRYKYWLYAVLVFSSSYLVFGQTPADTQFNSGWSLVNFDGDLILTRSGRRTAYQNGSPRPQGILLGAKDMAQTGKGTAELHLLAGGDSSVVLRLSENTSVIINEFRSEISLDLLYGRVQIQSDSALTIKTGNFSSFFRNCDIELEYVAKPGFPQPALLISCYKGDGELVVNADSDAQGARFAFRNSERLSLEYRTPFFYVERKSLDPITGPIINSINNITEPGKEQGNEPGKDPALVGPALEESERSPERSAENPAEQTTVSEIPLLEYNNDMIGNAVAARNRTAKIRNGFTITGLSLMSVGAAAQGYVYFGNPGTALKNSLLYGGYGSLGLGAVFLIMSIVSGSPSGNPIVRTSN